jgi:hypothetical protein
LAVLGREAGANPNMRRSLPHPTPKTPAGRQGARSWQLTKLPDEDIGQTADQYERPIRDRATVPRDETRNYYKPNQPLTCGA